MDFTLSMNQVHKADLSHAMSNLHSVLALIEQLRGGFDKRISVGELHQMMAHLLNQLPVIVGVAHEMEVVRGRIDSKELLSHTDEFTYRNAKNNLSYGRCHKPGSAMFYGARTFETVLPELDPQIGNNVHFGVARLKPNKKFNVMMLGGLDHMRRSSRLPLHSQPAQETYEKWQKQVDENSRLKAWLVDAFLAERFSLPAQKGQGYALTACVSDLLFKGAQQIQGIAYPSVAHSGGLNLAILPQWFDELFEWKSFTACRIIQYLGYGIYGWHEYAASQEMDAYGNIAWKKVA